MRLTEFIAYVSDDMPSNYVSYHLNMSSIRANKDVQNLKRAIKKQKTEEKKMLLKGNKNGTESVDIFGDE